MNAQLKELSIDERLCALHRILNEVSHDVKLARAEITECLTLRREKIDEYKTRPEYSEALNTLSRMKEIRTLTRYTQTEYGMLFGITQSLVSKIENGQANTLGFHRAIEIADLLTKQEARHLPGDIK